MMELNCSDWHIVFEQFSVAGYIFFCGINQVYTLSKTQKNASRSTEKTELGDWNTLFCQGLSLENVPGKALKNTPHHSFH